MRPIPGVADCERKKHETGWCEMPATTQLAATSLLNVNDARCIALFASGLQQSNAPTAEAVALAINRAIRRPPRRCRDAHVLGAPAGTGGGMNETCDRCGPAVRAAYRVARSGELYLCRHCTNLLWPALSTQGWNVREQLVTVSATGARQIKIP